MDNSLNSSERKSRKHLRIWLQSLSGDGVTGFLRDRIVIMVLLLLCLPSLAFAVELQADTEVATAGYYQLEWGNADAVVDFEIQEADNPAFSNPDQIYQGPDRATVITGRSDGTYYYRARLMDENGPAGDWSNTVKVQVKHHSLTRAFEFFAAGAVVFLAILIAILAGNRRYHSKESQ